ncbi:MAG TPA: TIGR03960 family B12-binding radical SAM protein [Peptococcaceae bacterium]|nr:TIGR03960 family B12-binding radical SAM protein [Clostridia bacterium]HOB81919.1 TIGR03960 family B12-binding radical SAM protein [Peptococcaceae bacterium]HPZ71100.1 TIGR03960 family B12-binding radical SAM protein [Peptococcaceae bacterium]HQD53236.1 TIGR03960 family B12-binding radical SAM protein [Peptococcaceae bacterium]
MKEREQVQEWLEEVLPKVSKPLRYLGNEYNAVKKDWQAVKLRFLFAFPDVYEVGMSHLGLQIIYGLVNEQSDYLMERVFAPWTDFEAELRARGIPLFSLESATPIAQFDCIGFTLQYEMSYSNILNMLDLGRIPLLAKERGDEFPIIMAGGPCAYNPEPLAEFIDFFVLGEGEEIILEIGAVMAAHRAKRQGKQEKAVLLKELAQIPGIYVPAFYEARYDQNGKFAGLKANEPEIPSRVVKRVVKDLDQANFPLKPIVPYLEIVHDRMMLEVLRGCTRGCRFCQAGVLYRPVRERSQKLLVEQAEQLAQNTGHNEISLTSLSTSDYSCVEPLLRDILNRFEGRNIGVSLPSLRVDSFSVNLAKEVQRVRKTGLTFAPEAGTQRLRDVINKNVTEEDLLQVTEAVFREGWTQIKLYFMLGLPTETYADLDGIADLASKVLRRGKEILREIGSKKAPSITVSVSSFVPKPHTPFQWEAQDSLATLQEKQSYLRTKIRERGIVYNYHDAEISFLEAVFAKGDRRLGKVLLEAWRRGCRFDGWSEHFRYESWREAFREVGLIPEEIANVPLDPADPLPWDHLDSGVRKEYLLKERERAYQGQTTGDCRLTTCSVCGICQDLKVRLLLRKGEA